MLEKIKKKEKVKWMDFLHSSMSLLIKNGRVFLEGKIVEKNIYCEEGRIRSISSEKKSADTVVNARRNLVIPGAIDPHVHFREPGLTQKEDFLSGSKAAAKGGITTFQDMPNTIPPTLTVQELERKRELAAKSVVNYGLHFGASESNLEEIKQVTNVPSVKVYMDVTTGDLKIDDHSIIKDILNVMKVACFHAENEHIPVVLNHLASAKGVAYFCHVSSKHELELCHSRKNVLDRVCVEATPQHLFLNAKDIQEQGAFAEMKPRLKEEKDNKALWEGIRTRKIDTIGTDHAPHLKAEKEKTIYPFGIPGVETMLPLLLDALNGKRLELQRLVELCCHNPALIFRMKGKGFLRPHMDADITIVDLDKKKEVVGKELVTKCRWSPWEGKVLKGWPVTTIVGGNLVFDDGEFHPNKGKEVSYG